MENLYKYDLKNRFPNHHFNLTEKEGRFSIEVLDANNKLLGGRTYGYKAGCFDYARDVMGIAPHILPMLRPAQRDKLKDCPTGLEILLMGGNKAPFHKKQRRWGNDWIDV